MVEPTNDNGGEYVVPSYTYLKLNSKCVHFALRNLSCRTVLLKKGTVVAQLSPANKIPDMLAPEFVNSKPKVVKVEDLGSNKLGLANSTNSSNWNNSNNEQTRIDKLFSKLDLSGYDKWSEDQRQVVDDCIRRYHHIFAVEDLELGKTDIVKHVIHLDDYTPFKECYR